jgi:hypothetical protein
MRAVGRRGGGGSAVRTGGRCGCGAADCTGGQRGRWCGTLEPPACITHLHGGTGPLRTLPPLSCKPSVRPRRPPLPLAWIPSMRPLVVAAARLSCGTAVTPDFSEGNQVQTYMHARIKFHAYSDI